MDAVAELLSSVPKEHRNTVAHFLEVQSGSCCWIKHRKPISHYCEPFGPPAEILIQKIVELSPSPTPDIHMLFSAGWSEDSLLRAGSSNFNCVPCISASLPPKEVTAKLLESEASGVPLIIEGWHLHPGWNLDLFSMEGFVGDGEQGELCCCSALQHLRSALQ